MKSYLKFRNSKSEIRNFFLFNLILIVFLSGCASLGVYNPATGRKEFIAISTPEEIKIGADMHQDIIRKNKLSQDKDKTDRLWRIGERVAQVADRQDYKYKFYLLDKDEINAFTTPGGNVYFYAGLFDKLKTDDQIAGVLAHEIGHCTAKHVVKKLQAALGYNLIGGLILDSLQMGSGAKQVTSIGTNLAANVIFSAYSRQDELQADQLGVKYMYLAGYDLNAMVEVLEVLEKESKGGNIPLLLRTHPFAKDRIATVKKEIEAVKFKYGGT